MYDLRFSICVPVYNVEKYLYECVESVLNQSYGMFELILVDDGSTDGSYQICKEYQSKDNRVNAFTKKNGGQISAREFAFEHASGDIILCLDSDDYLEKNALEILNGYFVNEKPDCIYFNWQRTSNGIILNSKKEITLKETLNDLSEILKRVCTNYYYNSMCIKAFKKKLLPKQKLIDFYKVRRAEDLIQTLGILESAKSVLFIPDILYNYRVNLQSVSHNTSFNRFSFKATARPYVYSYLKNKDVFSNKDWDDYGLYCIGLFFDNIYSISNVRTSVKEKMAYFEDARKSQYFKDFLYGRRTKNCLKNVIIFLFENKMDFAVIGICFFAKTIKKIVKKL